MRKVELSMNEHKKYEVIKHLADHPTANKQRAARELDCTLRHINRMLQGYKQHGKAYFEHGNRGRTPSNVISDTVKKNVLDLYKTKYADANFTHFTEILLEHEKIELSTTTIASILENDYILSPMGTKAKRRSIRKKLVALEKNATTKKEKVMVQANLVGIENAHPRRPRCAYFGELVQMDASSFDWIPGNNWHLHLAIDDATGCIVGAYFDTQETLKAYYNVFYQILTNHGIPYKFLTDRRTVFEYKKKISPSIDEDTYTQFAYACKQLGVQLDSTSVPQAKGRVERLNGTLQSRLPVELRLAKITTIESANEFLNHYVKEFNQRFALPLDNIKSVFEIQPSNEKINLTLATICERTVDMGHCLKFMHNYYKLIDKHGEQAYFRQGTKALVIQAFDGEKYCSINDTHIFVMECIPSHESFSKELDLIEATEPKTKARKITIPSQNHPWRRSIFLGFVRKQAHQKQLEEI